MKYNTIFFDLDETIWDYKSNAEDTLVELFQLHQLDRYFMLPEFIEQFFIVNKELWDLFDLKKIEKSVIRDKRFPMVLERLRLDDLSLALTMQDQFIDLCPRKKKIFPMAVEVIQQLSKHYQLHIITNGFEEIQLLKLKSAGVDGYFDQLITSELAGAQKPDTRIFNFALQKVHAEPSESLMIGDNLVADVMGAKKAGMEAIFFNPNQTKHNVEIDYEIQHLSEIIPILL